MTMSADSSHHPQEVILAQFSLYVHQVYIKPYFFIHANSKLSGDQSVFLYSGISWVSY